MSNVIVKENESLDSALRRFKRSCAKAGIQQEIRKTTRSRVYAARRNPKLPENANTVKTFEGDDLTEDRHLFVRDKSF